MSSRSWTAIALAIALCAAATVVPAAADHGGNHAVRLALSGFGAERVKTVPIAKQAGGKTRVVMSVPPSEVGDVAPGDAVWAGGEVEVSVTCLEPMPKCVGARYDYSPRLRARFVLAPSSTARSKSSTLPIGDATPIKCSQKLPNRNHHCVLAVEGTRQIKQGEQLPCSRCYVNMLVDAFHPSARRGNVVVIGVDDDHRISQNKGMMASARFSPGPPPTVGPPSVTSASRSRVAVAPASGRRPRKVIYSRRLDELREGEKLLVRAKAALTMGHLRYNALIQSQLVLSEKPGSERRSGLPIKVASLKGVVTAKNGFNCTRGHSGHSTPCVVRKAGAVRILRDVRARRDGGPFVPLYLNLVVESREVLFGGRSRHRSGDFLKVARKAGFLEVRRFGPD